MSTELDTMAVASQKHSGGPRVTFRSFVIPSVTASETSDYFKIKVPSFGELHQFKITIPNSEINLSLGIKDSFATGTNEEIYRVINASSSYDETDIHAFYSCDDSLPGQGLSSLFVIIENIGLSDTGNMQVELIVYDY